MASLGIDKQHILVNYAISKVLHKQMKYNWRSNFTRLVHYFISCTSLIFFYCETLEILIVLINLKTVYRHQFDTRTPVDFSLRTESKKFSFSWYYMLLWVSLNVSQSFHNRITLFLDGRLLLDRILYLNRYYRLLRLWLQC